MIGPDSEPPRATLVEAERKVREAAGTAAKPAQLRELAADPNLLVRATIALNPACTPEVDDLLARDGDERVRALLAGRIARLVPELDQNSQAAASDHIRSVLMTLARDEAARVRAAIAHEVSSLLTTPRELVLLLAQDCCVEVSGPVLRLSPVLTDADLLQLLATPPCATSAELIASRPGLSAAVADAVVAYADAPAIRVLLSNASACIQEATLDALVGRAPPHEDWHAALVRRPNLSPAAIQSLSGFIAADLLRALERQAALDAKQLDNVRQCITPTADTITDQQHLCDALRLRAEGRLSEEVILAAAQAGQTRRLAALLAVASNTPLAQVDRAVEVRNAKGLVALAWLARLSTRAATIVQSHLGQIDPDRVLLPSADGGYPLTPEEIEWQQELLRDEQGGCSGPALRELLPAADVWPLSSEAAIRPRRPVQQVEL